MSIDFKHQVSAVLKAFGNSPLCAAATGLLNTLGYSSDKTIELDGTPAAFLDQFNKQPEVTRFNEKKALVKEWQEVQLLFQLTDDEISSQGNLFNENEVRQGLMHSYLFFAVKLKGESYARGKLADITRHINRLFPQPVMVLFEYDAKLSIAVINRRQHKRDADKDVLGKVTLIQDINLKNPHRGHLDIIESFSMPALQVLDKKKPIKDFDSLHEAWKQVFNVELLNKKFYRELSDWYFWAMGTVRFPFDQLDPGKNKEDLFKDKAKIREHDAKNLIRLLTRLLFVWFVKEKGLIPESLFEEPELQKMLKEFDPKAKETNYYKAILQNLFFATLNQTHGKREFRKDGRHQNTTTLLRYKNRFQKPDAFVELLEMHVPFMNGGLFECLDRPHPTLKGSQGGAVILYEDGFSDRKDNILKVPDYLFFAEEQTIDLSDIYGDKKRSKERVRGIIPLLNSYKFTIMENTPVEQEIALDPELLGKVFENLLASYNPETKTTARKQTGSFYTPRTIVDYMVDESLKAYLQKALCEACPEVTEDDAKDGLEILFAYREKEHAFSNAEKRVLIEAIDKCKILDPACGSGAFPMGILHKLEFILGKLDKKNELWRDRQITKVDATIAAAEQIDDTSIRDNSIKDLESLKLDIQESFANNELGYGRKLYLIENCLYGVDIQSIATQVSKLRFFISLIVDQRVNAEKDNFGIRPLPNLEIKFTTADTLIKIEKPDKQGLLFANPNIKKLEDELKKVRHNLFNAKTPSTKRKYRDRDNELREEIAAELEADGWGDASARQLASWDPYDQNASSSFFDQEWMFDIKGFDIVIGNPPYVQIQKFPKEQKVLWESQKFDAYSATADIYCLFYERGAQLLKDGGHLCYITSNKWMRAGYGDKLRDFLSSTVNTEMVLDFGMAQNFGAATTYTNILGFSKQASKNITLCCYASDVKSAMAEPKPYFETNSVKRTDLTDAAWVILTPQRQRVKDAVEEQGVPLEDWDLKINYGIKTGLNDAFYLPQQDRDELVLKEPQAKDILVPLLRGRFVDRYATNWDRTWMINAHNGIKEKNIKPVDIVSDYPVLGDHLSHWEEQLRKRQDKGDHWTNLRNCAYVDEFLKPKIIYPNMTKYLPFYYDKDDHFYGNQKCFIATSDTESLPYLTAVLNSSTFRCCFKDSFPELLGNTYELSKIFFEKMPIKKPTDFEADLFEKLVTMIQFAKRESLDVAAMFLESLIDACVIELYFPEEAKLKDLQFMQQTADIIDNLPGTEDINSINMFMDIANNPKHPIRNQLMRLTIDSPDIFAVIKEEGRV